MAANTVPSSSLSPQLEPAEILRQVEGIFDHCRLEAPSIDELLSDPSISFWLKDALRRLQQRDVVDAFHDAQLLAAVMKRECDKALGPVRR